MTNPGGVPSAVATVTVNITEVNSPPLATRDAVSVSRGQSITIDVLVNDSDPNNQSGASPLRAIDPASVVFIAPDTSDSTQAPLSGTVVVDPVDGSIEYTHDGSSGSVASFRYTVADLQGAVSAPAQVNITIIPDVNVFPIAAGDTADVVTGGSVAIAVLANDSDPDGETADLEVVAGDGSTGTTSVSDGGVVTYTNTGGAVGTTDSFTYTITDAGGASDTATVTLTIVAAPNVAPLAADDTADVVTGESVAIAVLANDSDPDGETADLEVVAGAGTNGTTSVSDLSLIHI